MVKINDVMIKIELLCLGLRPNELSDEVFLYQNPFKHKRTGNAGLQLTIGDSNLVTNVPTGDKFTHNSPFHLNTYNDKYFIFKNDKRVTKCSVIPVPNWYELMISGGVPIGKIFLQEGTSTLITAVYNNCDYIKNYQSCRFCAIGRYAKKMWTSEQIAESIKVIKETTNLETLTINLTGGNTETDDRGSLVYLDVVKKIRKITDIPICVETSPPEKDEFVDMLFDVGVNSFMMNLEVWDNNLRKLFLPGKSKITKQRYFEVWEHAQKLVGAGNVSSVLIVGLESKYSTLAGAIKLIENGVIPSIMPFRPNTGSYMQNFDTPSPESVFFVTSKVSKRLFDSSLSPHAHPGCISCGGCAAEGDLYKSMSGE